MRFLNCHTHFSKQEQNEIFQVQARKMEVEKYHSIGIHPWDVDFIDIDTELASIKESINSKTLAIGECGLDKLKGGNFYKQQVAFEQQIALSEELNLPVIIHCVKAWNELESIHKRLKPKQTWIYHGFTKFGIVEQVVSRNIIISLGVGIIQHPKKTNIINAIPNEQLLVETDHQDIEIKQVYDSICEAKGISLQELVVLIESNFKSVFTKWEIG